MLGGNSPSEPAIRPFADSLPPGDCGLLDARLREPTGRRRVFRYAGPASTPVPGHLPAEIDCAAGCESWAPIQPPLTVGITRCFAGVFATCQLPARSPYRNACYRGVRTEPHCHRLGKAGGCVRTCPCRHYTRSVITRSGLEAAHSAHDVEGSARGSSEPAGPLREPCTMSCRRHS